MTVRDEGSSYSYATDQPEHVGLSFIVMLCWNNSKEWVDPGFHKRGKKKDHHLKGEGGAQIYFEVVCFGGGASPPPIPRH